MSQQPLKAKKTPGRRVIPFLLPLTVPLWLDPLAWYLAYRPEAFWSWLGKYLIYFELSFGVFSIIAIGALIVGPVLLLSRQRRSRALIAMAKALIFLLAFLAGLWLGAQVNHYCLEQVTERSSTILKAIRKYEREVGHAPEDLGKLIPDYLEPIPSTGIGAYPELLYSQGHPDRDHGNPWTLTIKLPSRPGNLESLIYYPLQNYPEKRDGTAYQQIGRWAWKQQ